MTPRAGKKSLVWVSRIAILLGLIPLLLIHPLCDCPRYFIGIAAIGLVPLWCGPRLYRWLGGGYIAIALLFAQMEHSHAIYIQQQVEQIRAEPAKQTPLSTQ